MYVFVGGDIEHLSVFRWDETSEAGEYVRVII